MFRLHILLATESLLLVFKTTKATLVGFGVFKDVIYPWAATFRTRLQSDKTPCMYMQ